MKQTTDGPQRTYGDAIMQRAYSRALTKSMKYWKIWDDLLEQGKGSSGEAQVARQKYLDAEYEMHALCAG